MGVRVKKLGRLSNGEVHYTVKVSCVVQAEEHTKLKVVNELCRPV